MASFMAGRHLFESAQGRSVVSVAAIIASGVNQDGRREILGLGLGDPEAQVFWVDFQAACVQRGLSGVQLIISDAHEGFSGRDQPSLYG